MTMLLKADVMYVRAGVREPFKVRLVDVTADVNDMVQVESLMDNHRSWVRPEDLRPVELAEPRFLVRMSLSALRVLVPTATLERFLVMTDADHVSLRRPVELTVDLRCGSFDLAEDEETDDD